MVQLHRERQASHIDPHATRTVCPDAQFDIWHAPNSKFWEMVDVVDVLDAFEAKRKRVIKPVFEAVQWAIGGSLQPIIA